MSEIRREQREGRTPTYYSKRALRGGLSEEQKRKIKIDITRIPEWERELASFFQGVNELNRSRLIKWIDDVELIKEIAGINESDRLVQRTMYPWLPAMRDRVLSGDFNWSYVRQCKELVPHAELLAGFQYSFALGEENFAKNTRGATSSAFWAIVAGRPHAAYVERVTAIRNAQVARLKILLAIKDNYEYLRGFVSVWQRLFESGRIEELNSLLYEARMKRDAIERYNRKHGNAHAKAASLDGKTRAHARTLRPTVVASTDCPYCGSKLGADRHLDHIYPIKHGGLSTSENLVWACAKCNGRKGDMGLIEYVRSQGLSLDIVTARLHRLGKRI